MAPTEWEKKPVKKPERDSRLTIVIMRSLGGVRTFKISSGIFFGALLFIIIYIPLSAFVINKYMDLRRAQTNQSRRIKELQEEVFKGKQDISRYQKNAALLEDYIRYLEEPQPSKHASTSAGTVTQRGEAQRPGGMAADGDEGSPPSVVDINDMLIQREGHRMTVDFKLVKKDPGETAIQGYIHMIALGSDDTPPPEWTFPRVTLRDGAPVNFRRGQLFVIQRFKPVQGRFYLAPNSAPPRALKVLVYDQSGKLILEKIYEVSHVS